ncbi:hypothetical protein [Thiocapsa sp. N5-Cardenillas]|uniref:hypothetical protein n=1 Tax=Thiocapsa sp. N5-Cardenillas TaxID=3137397 RepID=UPI0035AFEF25
MKILLALQYHSGDEECASSLAKLIASIMPEGKCRVADVMFSAAPDADIGHEAVGAMATKFDQVHTYRVRSKANGWPKGPNLHAAETMFYVAEHVFNGRWDYNGVWLMEPDCLPLHRDFINLIVQEWTEGARTILGPWIHTEKPHINGNCIIGTQFGYHHRREIFVASETQGWDWQNRKFICQWGRPSRLMFSDYHHGTEGNPWRGCEFLFAPRALPKGHPLKLREQTPVYLHGVKSWQKAHPCVQATLLGEQPVPTE